MLPSKPTLRSLAGGTADSPDSWKGAREDSVSSQKLFQWKSLFCTGDILDCPSGQSHDLNVVPGVLPGAVFQAMAVGEAWPFSRVQSQGSPGHHVWGPKRRAQA